VAVGSPLASGAGEPGGVNFIGSMIVCPDDWKWRTSHPLSSSSTGGHTRDGAVLSSPDRAGPASSAG
jgi:hypothetical protein